MFVFVDNNTLRRRSNLKTHKNLNVAGIEPMPCKLSHTYLSSYN